MGIKDVCLCLRRAPNWQLGVPTWEALASIHQIRASATLTTSDCNGLCSFGTNLKGGLETRQWVAWTITMFDTSVGRRLDNVSPSNFDDRVFSVADRSLRLVGAIYLAQLWAHLRHACVVG
jgi:hypothetical protein